MFREPFTDPNHTDYKKSQQKIENPVNAGPWYKHPALLIMLNGVLISLPLIIFLLLILWFFRVILNLLTPITFILSPGQETVPWYVHFLSILILIGFFFLVGFIARKSSGKALVQQLEIKYLSHIPLYSTVRDTVQQFSGIKKMPFSQVVLIDPYETGVFLTGFVTEEISNDLYTVFVPTAPNPLNGNIYHVPKARLIFVPIGSDAAIRTIVGMGTGSSFLFSKEKIQEIEMKADVENEPTDLTT